MKRLLECNIHDGSFMPWTVFLNGPHYRNHQYEGVYPAYCLNIKPYVKPISVETRSFMLRLIRKTGGLFFQAVPIFENQAGNSLPDTTLFHRFNLIWERKGPSFQMVLISSSGSS